MVQKGGGREYEGEKGGKGMRGRGGRGGEKER